MEKLNAEKLIKEYNLTKNGVFDYLLTHTIKDFRQQYNMTKNRFDCIVNFWGGYKTPEDKHRKICAENGKQSCNTPERLLKCKKNGSRGYEQFTDVINRIDIDEFIKDYNTLMTKKAVASKYNCTLKMIDKIIVYFNLKRSYEQICELNSIIKTSEGEERRKEAYKQKMLEKYGVDNYFASDVFKENNKIHNIERHGVEYYAQSDDFRKKFHPKFVTYVDNGTYFDSSLELMFWVYARDHCIEIKREPLKLKYEFDGELHTYFPDFICNNNIIEIKGRHMLDENKKLKAVYKYDNQSLLDAKQKCMEENNVITLTDTDMLKEIEYFTNNYKLEDFRNE